MRDEYDGKPYKIHTDSRMFDANQSLDWKTIGESIAKIVETIGGYLGTGSNAGQSGKTQTEQLVCEDEFGFRHFDGRVGSTQPSVKLGIVDLIGKILSGSPT